jgi:hypothetical protein
MYFVTRSDSFNFPRSARIMIEVAQPTDLDSEARSKMVSLVIGATTGCTDRLP